MMPPPPPSFPTPAVRMALRLRAHSALTEALLDAHLAD